MHEDPGAAQSADADGGVAAWRRRAMDLVGHARPRAEEVPLGCAVGRVLVADVVADEDIPSGPVSAMDGFAVRLDDLALRDPRADERGPCAGRELDEWPMLPVALDLPAASGAVPALPPGHAARIMTGAPLPEGADTVIEVERTDAAESGAAPRTVRIERSGDIERGRHVRGPGEEVARGDLLARSGDRVGPGLVGLLTTLGVRTVAVRSRPMVGVLVTGDELVASADEPGAPEQIRSPRQLLPGAVRESNGAMLGAALGDLGLPAEVARCGDDPADFHEALTALAARCDVVVTSGGIGHGAYDVVKRTLGPAGEGTSTFVHLALRPGGPQGAGRFCLGERELPLIHLPGTPVGALIAFHLFVRPALLGPEHALAVRARVLEVGAERASSRRPAGTVVLAGRLARDEHGTLAVRVVPGRRLAPYGRADCLVLAAGAPPAVGDVLPVLPL